MPESMEPEGFNASYYSAIDQIYHAQWSLTKLGHIERVKRTVARLWPEGHPAKLVQVAGTSGKGSVSHFLEAGFGIRHMSGSMTSPHLFDYRERFSIQGQPVTRDDVVDAWENRIRPVCVELALQGEQYRHSTAEINILLALALFEKYHVEWAAIETGVGGRYDQTTALTVEAAALTNVGADHEHLLGSELWQRTLDKVGICRPSTPFFTSIQDEQSLHIVTDICAHMSAPLIVVTQEDVENVRQTLTSMPSDLRPEGSLLDGEHQLWNAALAAKVLARLLPDLSLPEMVAAFASVRFPGRFQEIEPGILVDIAHNPDKIGVFTRQLVARYPAERKIFVVSLSGKRSPREIFAPVIAIAHRLIVTTASYKGVALDELEQDIQAMTEGRIPVEVIADPREAYQRARELREGTDMVVLTGSTYMIDQALNPDPYVRHINGTYGWRNAPPPGS